MGILVIPKTPHTNDADESARQYNKTSNTPSLMITKRSSNDHSKDSVINVDECLRQLRAWLRESENHAIVALSVGLLLSWECLVVIAIYNLLAGGPLNQ